MPFPTGSIKKIQIAEDGWSAWVTIAGLGKGGVAVNYSFFTADTPNLVLSVRESSGEMRDVVATTVIRKPYPEETQLDHKAIGDDLLVHVSLSEYVFATGTVTASAVPGWVSASIDGVVANSLGFSDAEIDNTSSVSAARAAPVANFVTPDRQIVADKIHVEVVAGSIFGEQGDEVSVVRFIASDLHGNELSVSVDTPSLSSWGKGDASPVYSYQADIPSEGLVEGDLITVRAEVRDHIGNIVSSAPKDSIPGDPAAFMDQVYMLDRDGSFGRAYAYVDSSAAAGSGKVSADPTLAGLSPFKTIAAALVATQTFNEQTFGRANIDNAEIRLMAGTHTWVGGPVAGASAVSEDVWVTITRDPSASKDSVRITGATDGKNVFAGADYIKVEDLTIDRTPMGTSGAAIMRGQGSDTLWLNDVTFEGNNRSTASFSVPDVWVTQSEFNGTGRALSSFGSSLNMFRIRGVDADSTGGNIVNGHLLVGSSLDNLAVRFPNSSGMPNADGSIVAFNDVTSSISTTLLSAGGSFEVHGIAVLNNRFTTIDGPSSAITISGDGDKYDISNIVFHNNIVTGQRMNVGYNDVYGSRNEKEMFSLKWNELHQLNTKHDVFSADSENTGAWSVLYGVGFESNYILNKPAGHQISFGPAFDGLGSDGPGVVMRTNQTDAPDLVSLELLPAAAGDTYVTSEDTPLEVPALYGLLANDQDPYDQSLSALITVQPRFGQLTVALDGSFQYTPDADFSGEDVFFYSAVSGARVSSPAEVRLSVLPVNDAPVARDDYLPSANRGDVIRLHATQIFSNDSDVDGDALAIVSAWGAQNGSVSLVEGGIEFTVSPQAVGEASFAYTISDNAAGVSTAFVRMQINAVLSMAPSFLSPPHIDVLENTTTVTTVLAADPDEGQTVTYTIVGGADAALLTMDPATGQLQFLSAPDFEAPSDLNSDNIYEVRVRATDNAFDAKFAEQDFSIAILDQSEAPSPQNPPIGWRTIFGTESADSFIGGNSGSEVLYGLGGNDWLDGRGGDDWLFGEDGRDTLVGNGGNDILVGGTSADQFRFDGRVSVSQTDTIVDLSFLQGDTIVLTSFAAQIFVDKSNNNALKTVSNGTGVIIDSFDDLLEIASTSDLVELAPGPYVDSARLSVQITDSVFQNINVTGLDQDAMAKLGVLAVASSQIGSQQGYEAQHILHL